MIEHLLKFLKARGVDFRTFGTVVDAGSRDGRQAIELSRAFPRADVIAIECNPEMTATCRRNIEGYPRIRFVDRAINAHTGRCPFYPIDTARTVTAWADGNPGASSLFIATGDYPIERYVQRKIEVECIRLDDLCRELRIDVIDLIWMDLQGAELIALQSAGDFLDKVRYIYTEVSHRPIYHGQCLFDDVESFLAGRGFRRCTHIDRGRWQQDVIYENTRTLIDVMIPFAPCDRDIVHLSVRAARRFVENIRHIYLVSAENAGIEGTHFIDERTFAFGTDAVAGAPAAGEHSRWYFQQLVKLSFPVVHHACLEHVLAVDADTIFLRACRFTDGGRTIFNFGDDYHEAAFGHMSRLYPALHRMFAYSGIAHCMLFHRAWLSELHEAVESQHGGIPFWKAYLQAIDPSEPRHGASEAEIYFNFCLMFHADELTIRRLRWRIVEGAEDVQPGRYDYVNLGRRARRAFDWRDVEHRIFP